MTEPIIDAFVAALAADRKIFFGKATEAWRYKPVLAQSRLCVYCNRPVEHRKAMKANKQPSNASMLHIEHFIPRKLGGPHDELNLVASCAKCNLKKGNKDWLACQLAPSKSDRDALTIRRMEVMEISQNHLLRSRETAKTKPYVLTLLRQRWAHPRFVIRAALTEKVGLIGFGDADFIPEEIVVQLRLLGATSVERTGGVFTLSPINFHTAVWHLIDQNGWVRRLDLGAGLPDPTPPDDTSSRWHETFSSVGDIHRRREKMPWVHPKDRPPWHEKPMDPLTRRHLAALVAFKTNQPLDEEWLARHRATDDEFLIDRRKRADKAWRLFR